MRISATLALVGLLAALGAPVRAQSLAEVARQEADRRKAVQRSGKVYTNKDLKGVPSAPPSDPSAAGSADAAGAATPSADATNTSNASTDSANAASPADGTPADPASADDQAEIDKTPAPAVEGGAKDEAYWSRRMRTLAQQRDRDELLAEALQSRVNALTADFAGRDDPAQRANIGRDREKALAELDRLQKLVAEDLESIATFEEEARRADVPPGWLR